MTSSSLPTVVTSTGLQPQSATALLSQLITNVAATNPGYTANLPGSLIEDISSTDVGALTLIDSARVEAVNSLTPYGANNFLLTQLGNMYGIPQGAQSNSSVYVQFTGSVGFNIPIGFTVADGSHQYVVQQGVVIGSSGSSPLAYCVAVLSGSWAIPTNSVTQIVTSIPTGITLSVTNPSSGTPMTAPETVAQYRSRVVQAGLAPSQGMTTYLKTQLQKIPGVQPYLTSIRPATPGWQIICGGGDPYQIANAILNGVFDLSNLVGSSLAVTMITNANPGVVTTNLVHGLTTGSVITLTGVVGMTQINSVPATITVLTPTTFSLGIDTSSYGTYVSGGTLSPNPRNITVTVNDYPDTYNITFVNPPQQQIGVTITWNTSATNFISNSAISQLTVPVIQSYINSLPVGYGINLTVMGNLFADAIASVIPSEFLTRLVFAVTINGNSATPISGYNIIYGDPESYCYASSSSIIVNRG